MVRKIITYPNKRLFLKSLPVEKFDQELHTLLGDTYEIMLSSGGVGLAVIQVDVPLRIFIANITDENKKQKKEDLLEIINPVITPLNDELIVRTEGCLSIPDFFEEMQRHRKITLKYRSRFGKEKEFEVEDFLAVAIQHEDDHLDGRLFIEKLPFSKREKFSEESEKQCGPKKANEEI